MNRQDQQVTGPDFGEDYGLEMGIPGTNGPDERQSGLPHFDIPFGTVNTGGTNTNLYDIGTTPNWMPLFRKERSYTFSSALTWLKGRHQVRTGLDIVNHRLNHIQAEFGSFGGVRGGFQFSGLTTATPGYIPQVWNELGAFALGLPAIRQKDVQPEEMTAREWQYGLYVTDRWQATSKLTLNVGLRFEMYPLMKRADSGIERLDYPTYRSSSAGWATSPRTSGINVKKFYVAPRLGAIYRLTEDTVLRAGYGRTFNPLPWGRPMRGSFPFDIYFNQTAEQYAAFPIENGIPPVPIPDLSSGRVKLPPSTFIRSPNPDDVDRATIQQMNVAVEQRLPWDLSVELAYVHTRTDGGYADLDVNHSEPGAGQTGRKFFAVAGSTAINDWASRTKSRYHGMQIAVNRPYRNGLLLKGAYTLSRSQNETSNDEDGWAGLNWNHPSLVGRNFALAGFDRTHVFQMGFLYELPFAKQSTSFLGRLVQNWQLNGIFAAYSGTPFQITGTNPAANCPGCGTINDQRAGRPLAHRHGRLPHRGLVRQVALLAAHRDELRVRLRHQRAQPIPESGHLERGPRAVPLVPGGPPAAGDPHRGQQRVQPHQLGPAEPRVHVRPVHDVRADGGARGQPDLGDGHPGTNGHDRPPPRVLARKANAAV